LDAFVSQLLAHLQSSAFQDIAGAHVSARIPVSRSLLNGLVAQALQGTTTPVRQVDIHPREGDELDAIVTVSWPFVPPLKVQVAVDRQPQFPASPVLVLRWSLFGGLGVIASRLIGALDRLPAGVRLNGDRLELDIPVLAARSPAAPMLRYVRTLEVHTVADRAVIVVDLEVPEGTAEENYRRSGDQENR
jgi:hypothetical protein